MKYTITLLFIIFQSAILYSQKIGIGTNAPLGTLDVVRGTALEGTAIFRGTNHNSHFNWSTAEDTYIRGGKPGSHIFLNDLSGLGNVGIGSVITPSFKLTVKTTGSGYGIVHRNDDVTVGTWVGNPGNINGGWYGTYSNHPLMFFTNNGNAQITLLQNGNTGIGTINPVAKLHIAADGEAMRLSGTNPYFTMYNGASLKGYLWSKGANDLELGTDDGNLNGNLLLSIKENPLLILQSDGRVRVGANASNANLPIHGKPSFTVNGALAIKTPFDPLDEWSIAPYSASLSFYKNNDNIAFIDDDGDWNSVSDASLKENVKVFSPVLSKITKLQVSTYQYKWSRGGDASFGLIAQNVNEYFPEIVSENIGKDGKRLLAISYAKTGVLAIKAIQEQQDIIEQQQQKIENLEKRLEALEKKFEH